ncbi:hypothetical protein ACET3Z_017328 [Daucus carota]
MCQQLVCLLAIQVTQGLKVLFARDHVVMGNFGLCIRREKNIDLRISDLTPEGQGRRAVFRDTEDKMPTLENFLAAEAHRIEFIAYRNKHDTGRIQYNALCQCLVEQLQHVLIILLRDPIGICTKLKCLWHDGCNAQF